MSGPDEGDTERVAAHKRTMRFVYEHSVTLVAVSVAWFVASLPLVTIGPATLGAYAAIRSLRETGTLDSRRVASVLRRNGVHASLLSFLPVMFFIAAGLYLRGGTPRTGFETVIAVVGVYIGAYLVVALIPTFVAMAAGDPPTVALKQAYVWTASRPTAALSLTLVTAVIFVVTALLTIGFVLLFPAVAFSYHVEYLADDFDVATAVEESTAPAAPLV